MLWKLHVKFGLVIGLSSFSIVSTQKFCCHPSLLWSSRGKDFPGLILTFDTSGWTHTFFGLSSTSVILEGSTIGLGLRRFSIKLCHCIGRPTKQPRLESNEVCTRCSKFFGADMSGLFFFFFRNILRSWWTAAFQLQNVPVEKKQTTR